MNKFVTACVAALVFGSSALAQETYREELYEKGSITLTAMESHIKDLLEDNGVSLECMGSLTPTDVQDIYVIIERDDENMAGKRREVKLILDEKCG